jgi:hypothetical protein
MFTKLPGIVVVGSDLPVDEINPVFTSPIARISGGVGPKVGEEMKGSI